MSRGRAAITTIHGVIHARIFFDERLHARIAGGSQSCVPSPEQESCTMCSNSTPCWSAHGRDAKLQPVGTAKARRDDGKFHEWIFRRKFLKKIPVSQIFVRNFCATESTGFMPNARGEIFQRRRGFRRRLYSLKLILFKTSLTMAASNPREMISSLPRFFTTYKSRIASSVS